MKKKGDQVDDDIPMTLEGYISKRKKGEWLPAFCWWITARVNSKVAQENQQHIQ